MVPPLEVTFVVAVNNREVLDSNFLASPCLQGSHGHQVLIQEGFGSAAKAYNNALDRSVHDIVVFVHQDVFLPDAWLPQLRTSLQVLAQKDPNWGVLGCWGNIQQGAGFGHVYTTGHGSDGFAFEHPIPVQTLDEIVLVVNRSSHLRFDEKLPDFHFYGTDICMGAAIEGRRCYAISAFCIHNARLYHHYPDEFYRCYWHIKRKWQDFLPIQTSCIRISKFGWNYYKQRLRQLSRKLFSQGIERGIRVSDPRILMKEHEARDPYPAQFQQPDMMGRQ